MYCVASLEVLLVICEVLPYKHCWQQLHPAFDWRDSIVLLLTRLRTAATQPLLAHMFALSCEQTVSTYLRDAQILLVMTLKATIAEAHAPTRELGDRLACLGGIYSNVTSMVDGIHLQLDHSRNHRIGQLNFNSYCWGQRAKAMVSLGPTGRVNCITDVYVGTATDADICRHDPAFLGLLQAMAGGDIIADKGVDIRDLCKEFDRGFIQPCFREGKTLTANEVFRSEAVSRVRAHNERIIGNMRVFQILNHSFPVSAFPSLRDTLFLCAYLTHFNPPITDAPADDGTLAEAAASDGDGSA